MSRRSTNRTSRTQFKNMKSLGASAASSSDLEASFELICHPLLIRVTSLKSHDLKRASTD